MDFDAALTAKIDGKTKPVGALGRLERLAAQCARLQGSMTPVMQDCRLTIFAADHGIVAEGVSLYPSEVTRQMVANFVAGGAAANVFARLNGVHLQVVNAGCKGGAFDLAAVIEESLGLGTASFLHRPAMPAPVVDKALAVGRRIGAEGAYDAMAFGEMGIGNTSSATLLAHRLAGAPLADVVGRGTGLDDDGLMHKHAVLQEASARVPGPLSPEAALAEFGGFEIAMMAGAMIGAAEARRIVLVDGFIASAAALVAAGIAPSARAAMVFSHLSSERGHGAILDAMSGRPLLQLDMRLGEGTGAVLAWPLLKAAVAMLNEMASFDDAGISGPA